MAQTEEERKDNEILAKLDAVRKELNKKIDTSSQFGLGFTCLVAVFAF